MQMWDPTGDAPIYKSVPRFREFLIPAAVSKLEKNIPSCSDTALAKEAQELVVQLKDLKRKIDINN